MRTFDALLSRSMILPKTGKAHFAETWLSSELLVEHLW